MLSAVVGSGAGDVALPMQPATTCIAVQRRFICGRHIPATIGALMGAALWHWAAAINPKGNYHG